MKRLTIFNAVSVWIAGASSAGAQVPVPRVAPAAPAAIAASAPVAAVAPMAWFGAAPGAPTPAARPALAADARWGAPLAWLAPELGPRAPWLPDDPADSVYRLARDALSRGEYRRAADLFHEIADRYPKSAYAADCGYWEAFSRYRIGTTDDLRAAATALRSATARSTQLSRGIDVASLRTRIVGALAERGDEQAANEIRAQANAGTENGATADSRCDQEDLMVRVEALNALNQMDPASALPILRRVLEKKDECSAELRRRALFMVGRRGDTTATAILLNVAKTDPNATVRAEAVNWLPRMPGERVTAALEDLLRTSDDERVQRAAVHALMASDDPRARQGVRALIERKDAPVRLRIEALSAFDRHRGEGVGIGPDGMRHVVQNEAPGSDDGAYLRSLYPKLDNDRLKEAVIDAVSRLGGKDNQDFLLGIVRNQGEISQLRAEALNRVGRMDVPIADLAKMYDAADARAMREQIIAVLGNRKEPEATDKLIDIVKNGTDPYMKRLAINYLSRKNDPRTTKLLMELIEK